jgi:signal transduction histidine kinase
VETLFSELKRYVHFSEVDEAALRALHPVASPHFQRIAGVFYDRILAHDEARRALEGGEASVGRLKVSLVAWMHGLLQGPWDEGYFEKRCRIGRVHVRIALPQHYMFGAMSVLREELKRTVAPGAGGTVTAVDKILDLELAIMLHTYREDLLSQQARVERLATFGQLAGSIGHELRNPLGVIESSVYLLRSRMDQGDGREGSSKHLDRIVEQVNNANGVISNMLEIIRDAPWAPKPLRISAVIEEVFGELSVPSNVRTTVEGIADLPTLQGSESQLRQVFFNLLKNAIQAFEGKAGNVWVRGSQRAGQVLIAVEDDGPGVDVVARSRLFEPLITTKKEGVGLGLALVKRIVERHGGAVTYEPAARGARFLVSLPV